MARLHALWNHTEKMFMNNYHITNIFEIETTAPCSKLMIIVIGKFRTNHTRRLLTQCTLFYNIQNQLVATPFPPIVSPATYYGRYDHNLKYTVPAAIIDVYKFSFFPKSHQDLEPPTCTCTGCEHQRNWQLQRGCPTSSQVDAASCGFQHTIDIRKQFLLAPIT